MSKALRDYLLQGSSIFAVMIIVGFFFWITSDIFISGLRSLDLAFFTHLPENAGRSGGIRPVLTSTLLILGIAIGVSLPISLGTSLVLSRTFWREGPLTNILHQAIGILAGVPSIVFGLFGNIYFCQYLGLGYSILSGGLTLACMILPLSTKLLEESMNRISPRLMSAADALGLRKARIIRSIAIPAILPQISAAYILSIGRALAETAALLFTSGYVMRDPRSIMDSGRTLSIHIFDLSMNISGGNTNAYKTALILLGLLLAINGIGHTVTHLWRKYSYGL